MRANKKLSSVVVVTLVWHFCDLCQLSAAPPGLLKIFAPVEQVEVPESRKLSELNGPWLILAATFAGTDGRLRAEKLAGELSTTLHLPAFIHEEDFDFTAKLNRPESGKVIRYANQAKYAAYAVLVGEYDRVDHPDLVRDLKRVKNTSSNLLTESAGNLATASEQSNPVEAVNSLKKELMRVVGRKKIGELGNAFATTNPLLPSEYFMVPEVDSFVFDMNSQVEFSLLLNTAKFTVVVATFSGFSTIANGKLENRFEPSSERMDMCAVQADKMVRELRKNGIEAYQFHDRTRSMVTIGEFDSLGRVAADGSFDYSAEIKEIMKEYRAGDDVKVSRFGEVIKAKHVASIPFDVNPTPIAVPKKSKRSIYSASLGVER